MVFLPDESRGLPPPPIANRNSVWLGLVGWASALVDNAFNRRPVIRAGVHRQVLYATVGWCVGYYISKRADYIHAKLDRDLMEYMRQHPEDFKEKATFTKTCQSSRGENCLFRVFLHFPAESDIKRV
ncbi:NADH dehydrogenase [ubiquinone] 1 subunit C2 isoform X1 [Dermochelys coriacea]|uniref:NADH dehydrogenase [ubiquinone] 1 subunit C2 isoform X1 n=1 Tax=Dermochelys coriacea TaxID=27794 RepID=UPI001CA842C0|nr:NADH dehydrogenase [ubiquinone] 1 subunit C2 isoform X1 [Dermochelys coriacea]